MQVPNAADLLNDLVQRRTDPRRVSLEDELALRLWCRSRSRELASRVQRLVDIGHHKNARRVAAHFRTRSEVVADALFRAGRKRWPTLSNMSPEEAEERRLFRLTMVISHINKATRFGQSAKADQFVRAKSNGGTRTITSFDWVDLARQRVLKAALTPFANLHVSQFMQALDPDRRGPAAVRKALLAALCECSADDVFLHFDVRDFYGSISHDWLERHLGIDPAIIQRQVHTGRMNIAPLGKMANVRDFREARRKKGRWGIPQGSALSPLIADQVMAAVIRSAAVFGELRMFVWSDNIGVIVPRKRARAIESLVCAAFAQHGAGPFDLRVKEDPISRFRFLGVWYRRRNGKPEAHVPLSVAECWEIKIGNDIAHASWSELDKIERHIRGTLAHWHWWPGAKLIRLRLFEQLQAARKYLMIAFARAA